MQGRQRLAALALLAAVAGCADHEPTSPAGTAGADPVPAAPPAAGSGGPEAHRLERQARRLALALGDAGFREYLRARLVGSPVREHKLHFQRFLAADGRRALAAMARADGEMESVVDTDATEGLAAEVYFPVPGHLERWDGGPEILVATALHDHQAPVAFDTRGRRRVLDPKAPPSTPVLALVPAEADFDGGSGESRIICEVETCGDNGGGGGGGSGSGGGGGVPQSPPVLDLHLTRAWFNGDYEGWLKGNPEFELHVLGPASPTDTTNMVTLQCVGEHAPPGYQWDMNGTSWSGDALVFRQSQMDAFNQRYPGRAYVIMALEDDDTACEIRTDEDRFSSAFAALKQAYQQYIGLKDIQVVTIDGVTKVIAAARSAAALVNALANLIKTNDDIIGIAMRDSVVGRSSTVGRWAVMNGKASLNGWLNLEMK